MTGSKKTVSRTSNLIFIITISLLSSFAPIQLQAKEEASQNIIPYQFMREADYVSLTGCNNEPYSYSLRNALNFLVFSEYHDHNDEEFRDSRDLQYTHRHSRNFFHYLSRNKKCQQPNLMRMAKELRILTNKGTIPPDLDIRESTKKLPLEDSEKYYVDKSELKTDKLIFEVLSRTDYMQVTGCLVSPKSYHKYHLALYFGVLNMGGDIPKGKKYMREFLNDVGAGMRTENNEIAPKCLSNSVKVLAQDLGLLNKAGTYVLP